MVKTVIVTGAGGALGKAVVNKFTSEDFEVIATVSPGKELGYSVQGNISVHALDLTAEADVTLFVDSIIKTNAAIDACICIAGGFTSGNLNVTDGKLLTKMMAINFETTYHLVRQVYKKMVEQKKGRIILVGAKPGMQASLGNNMVAYSLSKSLIFRLSEIINVSSKNTGVGCVVVVPDTIDTPANRAAMPTADFTIWTKPEKIADTMLNLITGSNTSTVVEV